MFSCRATLAPRNRHTANSTGHTTTDERRTAVPRTGRGGFTARGRQLVKVCHCVYFWMWNVEFSFSNLLSSVHSMSVSAGENYFSREEETIGTLEHTLGIYNDENESAKHE